MSADTPRVNALIERHTIESCDADNECLRDLAVEQVKELIATARDLERQLSAALAKVREVERERDALKRLGGIKCPCENEQPDPCPLCGATVADGICGAGNPLAVLNHERAEAAESRIAELTETAAAERRRGDKKEDEIIGLLARIAELEADALRYRLVRECDWSTAPFCVVMAPKVNVKLGSDCPSRERLDEIVDAARQKEGA